MLKVIETKKMKGETWYKVTEGRKQSEKDRAKFYSRLILVGDVPYEDFSLSIDPGWIPGRVTQETILADSYISGLYTFDSVENGDMGIYSYFKGVSFEGFDDCDYALLDLVERKQLLPGMKVRVIWRKAARSQDPDEMVWIPSDYELPDLDDE